MQKLLLGFSALCLLAVPITSASAQGTRGAMAACRTDAATFCQNVEAGGGRRFACLQENKAKLSPACAAAVEARGTARQERRAADTGGTGQVAVPKANEPASPGTAPAASNTPTGAAVPAQATQGAALVEAAGGKRDGGGRMAACRTDVATLCQTAEKGSGRMRCLKQNEAKLSPDCKATIGEMGTRGQALRQACSADAQSLCASVSRGNGGIVKCLKDNLAKVSPTCGQALNAMPARRS